MTASPARPKARIASGEILYGFWLELGSPAAAEILAGVGYDCAMIDMEHGPHSVSEAIGLMQAMRGTDCRPMARVPSNDAVAIKRILDAGVQGVMVPSVDDAEQAAAAAAACRYPPSGKRGYAASIVRASRYGLDLERYLERFEQEELLVICQIETVRAVENVEAIAAVEGVDLLFVGPNDLAADAGFFGRLDAPEVDAMVTRVEEACAKAGRALGGIVSPNRSLADLKARGYGMILRDADVSLLREAARASLAAQRQA